MGLRGQPITNRDPFFPPNTGEYKEGSLAERYLTPPPSSTGLDRMVSSSPKMRHSGILLAAFLLLGLVLVEGLTDVKLQLKLEKLLKLKFYFKGVDKVGGTSTTAQHAAFTGYKIKALKMGATYREKLLTFMSDKEGQTAEQILAEQSPAECNTDIVCDPDAVFRTADGSCNNLANPDRGQSFIPMRRFIDPQFGNGLFTPRDVGIKGVPLPSPRKISRVLHTPDPGASTRSNITTHMVMQWAQFLDHDITLTPIERGVEGSVITCCQEDLSPGAVAAGLNVADRPECFGIDVPAGDRRFSNRQCLNFVRSVQIADAACNTVPTEQLNAQTAYVDGSMIYGSTEEEQFELRTFKGGLLETSQSDPKPELLPENSVQDCVTSEPPNFCFRAGDERVDEHMGLATMHTIWLREHNRIARELFKINPLWSDERLFQETRRIVGAMVQKISFADFLPIVLSFADLNRFNLRPIMYDEFGSFYDPTVDASIRNSFATAAYRFGHSLIRSIFSQRNSRLMTTDRIRLRNSFGNTSIILSSNGDAVNTLTRGLIGDPSRVVDRHVTPELTNFLFVDENDNSLDLMSLNIQRGRDHGIPGYNAWRQFCNLPTASNFGGATGGLVDHPEDARTALKSLYNSPDDIDLFSGGMSETSVPGALLGPTFSCIVARQFQAIKIGDRFFYETGDPTVRFTSAQLRQIRKTSLARVICDNTSTSRTQRNVFRIRGSGNAVVGCSHIPKLDLTQWKE